VDEVDYVRVASAEGYNPAEHRVVGILAGAVYWRGFIRDILAEGSNGIQIVFTNPCNEPFTYQINGPNTKYVGVGDFHDDKYDDLGKHSSLYDLRAYAIRDTGYTGAKIDDEFCPITLHVYPSDDMKEKYTTHDPIIFSVAALLIFAFTSLVFFLYDSSVQHRQQTVMKTAVQSTAIVSSLFPANVRERIYPMNGVPTAKNKFGALLPESTKGILHKFLIDGKEPQNAIRDSGPIAHLYPDTTVFFSDIAGFTAWSSEREPTQVFHLLEALYEAFDKIAKARGVFKLGTIGDAYVAVIGLPTPRKHHAVVMALFAADCRDKMNEITDRLEATLGPVSTTHVVCSDVHVHASYISIPTFNVTGNARSGFAIWSSLRTNHSRCLARRQVKI
jgi:Adenylate and Guanylate cyclase catalytic domain